MSAFSERVRSNAIQSSASLIRGTALIVSDSERFSGQSGFMYAPKIAWLSRIGIRAGRFLCSVFVAKEAPIHGQLVIVPITFVVPAGAQPRAAPRPQRAAVKGRTPWRRRR